MEAWPRSSVPVPAFLSRAQHVESWLVHKQAGELWDEPVRCSLQVPGLWDFGLSVVEVLGRRGIPSGEAYGETGTLNDIEAGVDATSICGSHSWRRRV